MDEKIEFGQPGSASRFIVYVEDIPAYLIKETSRPRVTIENGKQTWDNMTMKLYDPLVPNGAQIVMAKLKKKEKFNYSIVLIDPVGEVIETWEITGGDIIKVDFGTLSWEKDSQCEITIELKIECARLVL